MTSRRSAAFNARYAFKVGIIAVRRVVGEYTPPVAGIFGVFRFDTGSIDRGLVSRMRASLAYSGQDGATVAFHDSSALGGGPECVTCLDEAHPVTRLNGISVAFNGRLDNREDLIAELRTHIDVPADPSDADVVARCYAMTGTGFVRHILGDFAVAVFDRREHQVVLARDAIGIRPLYYWRSRQSLTFGSEIRILRADPELQTRPNDRLLAELMLGQLHRHDDDGSTFYEGIHGLPASHIGIFGRTQSSVRRYWDFNGHRTIGRSFGEYAEGFRFHFRRAIQRRLRSRHPVAVAVSGGLDSSSIFCLAAQSASPAQLVGLTYSTKDGRESDESAYLAAIERESGRTIHYLHPPCRGVLFQSREVIACTEMPMLDPQWFRGERLLAAAKTAGARTLLTGHWGDQILFDQAYLVDLFHSGSFVAVATHLREHHRWFPDAGGELRRQFLTSLVDYDMPYWLRRTVRRLRRTWQRRDAWDDWYSIRFRSEAGPDVFTHDLSRVRTDGTGNATALACALYREVRSRYHALCLEWNNKIGALYGLDYAFPFLDRDLVEFVMGVPGSVLVHHGIPKALLRQALLGMVPDAILQRRTKGDFTGDVNRASRTDYDEIVRLLGPESLVVQCGYVDADKLTNGLRALEPALAGSDSCVPSWRLTALIALELWLRQFDNGHSDGRTDPYGQTAARSPQPAPG